MSYYLFKTLQYGVTLVQAFATPHTQLPTAFPLESAVAANLSQRGLLLSRVDSARPRNRMKKVPPGEAAHFVFGLRMILESGHRFSEKIMRRENA
ncbi:MAG: hypothetical protein ACRECA_06190 [Pseudolabrys sp.]